MKKRIYPIILGLVLLLVWTRSINPNSLMPSLKETLEALINLIKNGYANQSFWTHFKMSAFRLLSALLMALVLGIPLGLLSGYHETIRITIEPFINFYKPLPPLSYYVLLIMWLSIDESSKIMLLFLAAFAPIYVSTVGAVKSVNNKYILNAKSLGASNFEVFTTVILPASLPEIMTGIKTAVGVCYTTLASAEMIAATSGLGFIVMDAYNYLKTDVVISVIFIMGITGMLMDKGLDIMIDKLIFWKGRV